MVFKFLKKATKQLRSDVAGGMNLLSAGFVRPVETFKGLKTAFLKKESKPLLTSVKEVRKQSALRNIGATVRTTGLAALSLKPTKAISLLKGPTATSTVARTSGALFGAGLLAASPKARKTAGKLTNPGIIIEKGVATGSLIEKEPKEIASTLKDKGFIDTVKDLGVKGAAIAGGAALLGGGVALGANFLKNDSPQFLPSGRKSNQTTQMLSSATPIKTDIPKETIGTVQEPKKLNNVPTVKVSQKVSVKQKVYKAGSIDVKYNGRKRKRKRRRCKY